MAVKQCVFDLFYIAYLIWIESGDCHQSIFRHLNASCRHLFPTNFYSLRQIDEACTESKSIELD